VCHVFADFIQRIVHEKQNPMLILGSGRQVRCFTWIDDVARAIAGFVVAPETENEDFNLGNPQPVTMTDLAQRIFTLYHQMVGREAQQPLTFNHAPIYTDDVQVRIPSVDKARERLGWQATVDLDEMLRRCIQHELSELAGANSRADSP